MKWKLLTFVTILGMGSGLCAAEKAIERVETAVVVLNEVMQTPEHAIPRDLFNKCQCVPSFPA